MSSESEIWPEVLGLLKERIEREVTFNLWFSDLVLQKLVDDKAYLQTTNLYKKKIIESRFMEILKQAFCDVMGFEITPFIISVETRPFEEQYFELIGKEAENFSVKENFENGFNRKKTDEIQQNYSYDSENENENEIKKENKITKSAHRSFKLSKNNLNFPKVYNPESNSLEDVPLVKYLEEISSKDGMLLMSQSVPEYRPSYTFENFVVGDSNRMAYASCYSVAHYPAAQCNPLFLYGPPGIGKTHLLYAIAHHIEKTRPSFNIIYSTSEDFTNELVDAITHKTTSNFREKYRNADILMIDDIQFIGGKEATQNEFFHTFNTLYEANKQIIVASDRPPKDIAVLEKRIRSRFESGAIIDIKNPDPELRAAIIRRKAIDMNIQIPNNAVTYISDNVRENVRQIEGILKNINIHAMLKKQPITEELVRSVVGNVATGPIEVNPDKIIDTVAKHTEISRDNILGKSHTKNIVMARHISCYLIKNLTEMTYQQIGKFIGRHHSTVCDSVKFIENEKNADKALEEQIKEIMRELGQR